MRSILPLAVLLVVAVGVISGCSGPASGIASTLSGTTWVVERIVSDDGTVQRGSGESITFGADGMINLSSCNQCNGRYRLAGDVLTIMAPLACTRRACMPGTPELERLMEGERVIRRDGEYLVIEGGALDPDAPKLLLLPE